MGKSNGAFINMHKKIRKWSPHAVHVILFIRLLFWITNLMAGRLDLSSPQKFHGPECISDQKEEVTQDDAIIVATLTSLTIVD